jgi:hypothetical protein
MLYLIIIILIALALISLQEDTKPIKVSKYSPQLHHDTVYALFKTMSNIELTHDEDIQYLINMGKLDKLAIEKEADNYLFAMGEFPATELCLDPRDFAHLINVYSELVRGASEDQVNYIIRTLYK